MANVYKRERSPFYYFDVVVNGKRTRKTTLRTTKKEAQAYADQFRREALDRVQLGLGQQELTVREALFDHYLIEKKGNYRYSEYERNCRKICGDFEGVKGIGGAKLMSSLTQSDVTTYRRARKAQGAAAQTIDHELKVLSAAYHIVETEFRVRPGLKFPMEAPRGKPRFLLPEEETALLAELDPAAPITGRNGTTYLLPPSAHQRIQRQANYDLVVMLLDTGCRYGEIANLTWDAVDTIDWRWVHIYRTKVEGTAHGEGRLATTERVREVLRRRFEERGNRAYVFPGWVDTVEDDDGHHKSTQAIRRAMQKVGINHPAKVARFGRRDVRSLRDTFASKLRVAGMSLDRLQKLLGHASPAMTQKYANLQVDTASHEAVSILDTLNTKGR